MAVCAVRLPHRPRHLNYSCFGRSWKAGPNSSFSRSASSLLTLTRRWPAKYLPDGETIVSEIQQSTECCCSCSGGARHPMKAAPCSAQKPTCEPSLQPSTTSPTTYASASCCSSRLSSYGSLHCPFQSRAHPSSSSERGVPLNSCRSYLGWPLTAV